MNLKFSTCYPLLIIIINILIRSDGAEAPDSRASILQESDINVSLEPQTNLAEGLYNSELLEQIANLEFLFSKYEVNYLMETIIVYLVRYLLFMTHFSSAFSYRSYESIYNKLCRVVYYLESRSSCLNRTKMLFQSRVNELSGLINDVVNAKLISSLITDSGQIPKDIFSDIESISIKVKSTVSQITKILGKLSLLDSDSSLKHTSGFLGKVSDDCLKMFKNCLVKYKKMTMEQLNMLLTSRMKSIPNSTILLSSTNKFDYLSDMKETFEKTMQMLNAYSQFLETGRSTLSSAEIEEAKSLIAILFENGDLKEVDIFKQEEIVLTSLELLGLAALNLSLLDKEAHILFKKKVEEAIKSVTSIINYRGTEIRLAQTVVFVIREEARALMGYQEFLGLDFTVMNLDNSLLDSELLQYTYRFYEALLNTFELVKSEHARNIYVMYIKTLFSKVIPLFEDTLDYYKSLIFRLGARKHFSPNKIKGIRLRLDRKTTIRGMGRIGGFSTRIKGGMHSGVKFERVPRVIVKVGKKSIRKPDRSSTRGKTNKRAARREHHILPEKKSERQLMAQMPLNKNKLLSARKAMKNQLDHLIKMNYVDLVPVLDSALWILNEILVSERIQIQDGSFEADNLSNVISELRSIGDLTNNKPSVLYSVGKFADISLESSYSSFFSLNERLERSKHFTRKASASGKMLRRGSESGDEDDAEPRKPATGSKRRADEEVRPLEDIGPTIKLFGENPVFVSRRSSRSSHKSDEFAGFVAKQKRSSGSRSIGRKKKHNPLKRIEDNQSTYIEIPARTKSSHISHIKHAHSSRRQRSYMVALPERRGLDSKKKLAYKRRLYMVPPVIFDQEAIYNVVYKYNIKVLDFSSVSLNSPYDYIIQAIKFCYNEMAHLYYEVFPFVSGVEKIILKQIIIQIIILLKNLVYVLVAKDKKKIIILTKR